MKRLLATVSTLALMTTPAFAGAKTSLQWGVDRTVSPNSICAYDGTNTCQPVFTLPSSGGGTIFPPAFIPTDSTLGVTGGQLGVISPSIHVANTSALKLLNPTTGAGQPVRRDGFATVGDGGDAYYTFSSTPCTLNAGAGDNGSQIQAAVTGCWNVVYTNGVVNLALWGADPTHTNAADAAVAAWFAACMGAPVAGSSTTGGNRCFVPRGNYKMTTASVDNWDFGFNQGGGAEIFGAGAFASNFDFVTNGGYLLVHDSAHIGFFYVHLHDFGVTSVNISGGLGGSMQLGASPLDALNDSVVEEIRAANSTFAAGTAGMVINGFFNSHMRAVTTSDGCNIINDYGACISALGGDSLKIYQAAFSYINGSFSGASVGLHITGSASGQSVNQTHFDAMDIEVVHTPIKIDTTYPQGAFNNKYDVGQYVFCTAQSGCQVTGISTTSSLAGGSGYVNGTYSAVPLTGGSGTLATADITVSGGAVTSFALFNTGTGYTVGNTLSASNANLGGSGSGFSVRVASLVTVQGYGIVSNQTNAQTFNNELDLPAFDNFQNFSDGTCSGATSAQGVFVKGGTLGITTPSTPTSGTPLYNTTLRPALVELYAGTVTNVCYGTTAGICTTSGTPFQFISNPCDKMVLTYSATPGMIWQALP